MAEITNLGPHRPFRINTLEWITLYYIKAGRDHGTSNEPETLICCAKRLNMYSHYCMYSKLSESN